MDIKEIALKVADSLRNKVDGISHMQSNQGLVRFSEALIAEIAKQNEPVAFANEELDWKGWKSECVVKLTRKRQSEYGFTIPLYTFPPTAEQIANETAEAIAKFVAFQRNDIPATGIEFAEVIRSGAWRKFVKEV